MRDHIKRVASDRTRLHLVILTEHGPITREENVNYTSLSGKGLDTIIEVSVLNIALEGEWSINPPLTFLMTVRTKLIKVADGAVLYEHTLQYRGDKRKFTDWAINNAQPFREEFERAYQSLAEKIVEELFLLYDLPLEPSKYIFDSRLGHEIKK